MPVHMTREGDTVVLWGARNLREKYRGGGAGGDDCGGKEVRDGKERGRAKCPTCGGEDGRDGGGWEEGKVVC